VLVTLIPRVVLDLVTLLPIGIGYGGDAPGR